MNVYVLVNMTTTGEMVHSHIFCFDPQKYNGISSFNWAHWRCFKGGRIWAIWKSSSSISNIVSLFLIPPVNLFKTIIANIFSTPFASHRSSETMIHFLKGIIGTGILAMPIAFSRSGYIVGFVGTIVIGIIYTHCVHMLLRSHYELCKRKKVNSAAFLIKTLAY